MSDSNNETDDFDALIYRSTPGAPTTTDRKPSPRNDNHHESNKENQQHSKPTATLMNNLRTPSYLSRSKGSSLSSKIPPKMVLKFFIHEEVSSIQETKNNLDSISSHVDIDGMIHTQIISSDAVKNPPFALRLSDPDYPEDNYQFDTNFMTYYGSGEYNTLSIPKAVLGKVKVASYQRSVTKKFMPVLVQSK